MPVAIYLCPSILLKQDFRCRIRWQKSQSEDNLCKVRQNIKSASFGWHSPQEHAKFLSIFCSTGHITLSTLRWNRPYSSFSSLFLLLLLASITMPIVTALGGPGTIVQLPVLFDTGSSILSLFNHDLVAMRFYQVAYPDVGSVHITTVDGGTSEFSGYIMEWWLSKPGTNICWSENLLSFRQAFPGGCRLSDGFDIGTGPNTATLSVAI